MLKNVTLFTDILEEDVIPVSGTNYLTSVC